MKRFLSILMSSILFLCNNVFAGGEDKIVYVENGDKYIFVSTENIPKLVDLFQNKLNEQENKRFSLIGNCIYKSIVIGTGLAIGVAFCYSASKIENEDISKIVSASSGVLTTLGALAMFFVPEYINHKVNKFKNSVSGSDAIWQGLSMMRDYKFESQTGEYKIDNPPNDFKGLVHNLERISPAERHRVKHNKEINYDFGTYFDPCFSDNNEGIIIMVTRRYDQTFDKIGSHTGPLYFTIFRQSNRNLRHDYTSENFGMLSCTDQETINLCANRTKLETREESIFKFDDELFNKIFK